MTAWRHLVNFYWIQRTFPEMQEALPVPTESTHDLTAAPRAPLMPTETRSGPAT